jgi:hypothetical protein
VVLQFFFALSPDLQLSLLNQPALIVQIFELVATRHTKQLLKSENEI